MLLILVLIYIIILSALLVLMYSASKLNDKYDADIEKYSRNDKNR